MELRIRKESPQKKISSAILFSSRALYFAPCANCNINMNLRRKFMLALVNGGAVCQRINQSETEMTNCGIE